MKCTNCGKETDIVNARHCPHCDKIYCPDCARRLGFCSCFTDLTLYS